MNRRAQTALEYLILCGIVAVVVIMAFAQGGFMSKVQTSSNRLFQGTTKAIMGGGARLADYPDGSPRYEGDPLPINGGWCEWTPCAGAGSHQYRTCECPAPAFGGVCLPDKEGSISKKDCTL